MAANTYLVRNATTQHFVGVFCARRSNDLFALLDECVDPFECEYIELAAGEGLFAMNGFMLVRSESLRERMPARAGWQSLRLERFAADTAEEVAEQPGSTKASRGRLAA